MINNFVNDKIISLVENKIAKEESADDEYFQSLMSEIIKEEHLEQKVKKISACHGSVLGKYNDTTKELSYNLDANLKTYNSEEYGDNYYLISVLAALSTAVHEITHVYLRKYPTDSSVANKIITTYEDKKDAINKLYNSVVNAYNHIISLPKQNYKKRETLYYSIYHLHEAIDQINEAYKEYYDWNIEERIATYNGLNAIYTVGEKLLIDKECLNEFSYAPYFLTKAYTKSITKETKISNSPSIEYIEKSGFRINDDFLKYIIDREEFLKEIKKENSLKDRIIYGLPITQKEYIKVLSLLRKK